MSSNHQRFKNVSSGQISELESEQPADDDDDIEDDDDPISDLEAEQSAAGAPGHLELSAQV